MEPPENATGSTLARRWRAVMTLLLILLSQESYCRGDSEPAPCDSTNQEVVSAHTPVERRISVSPGQTCRETLVCTDPAFGSTVWPVGYSNNSIVVFLSGDYGAGDVSARIDDGTTADQQPLAYKTSQYPPGEEAREDNGGKTLSALYIFKGKKHLFVDLTANNNARQSLQLHFRCAPNDESLDIVEGILISPDETNVVVHPSADAATRHFSIYSLYYCPWGMKTQIRQITSSASHSMDSCISASDPFIPITKYHLITTGSSAELAVVKNIEFEFLWVHTSRINCMGHSPTPRSVLEQYALTIRCVGSISRGVEAEDSTARTWETNTLKSGVIALIVIGSVPVLLLIGMVGLLLLRSARRTVLTVEQQQNGESW